MDVVCGQMLASYWQHLFQLIFPPMNHFININVTTRNLTPHVSNITTQCDIMSTIHIYMRYDKNRFHLMGSSHSG